MADRIGRISKGVLWVFGNFFRSSKYWDLSKIITPFPLSGLEITISCCLRSLDFIRLGHNFGLTPTFAKVGGGKAKKWRKSTANFQASVMTEELGKKIKDEICSVVKTKVTPFMIKYVRTVQLLDILVLCTLWQCSIMNNILKQ